MDGHRLFRGLAIVAFLGTYVTILLGGNVMASDSGLACPDWPSCSGSYLVPLTGSMGIEWSHRLAALVLSLIILGLAVAGTLYESRRPILRNLALVCLVTVVGQALLGGLVVDSNLNIAIVLTHFLLATILFAISFLLAILSNLREIPRAWVDWAWHAGEDRPASPTDGAGGAVPTNERVPAIARGAPRLPEP